MNSKDLKEVYSVLDNVRSVFLAFNSNIDNIKHIDSKMEKFAKNANPSFKKELKNSSDLFSGIMHSMKFGEPAEINMDEELEKWLNKNIKPERQRMGGQAGIMANLFCDLGIRPIVYSPLLSKEQLKLFSNNVLLVDKGLKSPKEIKRKDKKKINWIFEFSKGEKFLGISAKDGTRFIAASRPDEFRLGYFDLDFDFSCAIISGFQCIKDRYADGQTYKNQFTIAKKIITEINSRKKPVHIEIAFTRNKKILKNTIEIASMADSIGLDESELINILDFLGEKALAKKIHKSHDVVDILMGMEKLSRNIKAKKIHIHGHGFFLAICKKGYHINPNEVKKSMEFAAVIAAAKASSGVISKKSIQSALRLRISKEGNAANKKIKSYLSKKKISMENGVAQGPDSIILVPTPLVKKVKDIVGLGDIISAAIFVAETGYSQDNRYNFAPKSEN